MKSTNDIPSDDQHSQALEEDALQSLEKELEGEKEKGEEWRQKYLRALADYHNVTKRSQEESQLVRQFAGQAIIEKLLPVVDVLQKAQEHCNDKGLDIAMKTMDMFLRDIGVTPIAVMGKLFDPYTMECIEMVEGEKDQVLEVVEKGYTLYDKLIRPAKVKVGTTEEAVKSKNH